jgi:hypothetical protein
MFRRAIVLLMCATLGGCGLAARKEQEDQMQAAMAARDRGFADCKAQYPEGSKQYVAKSKCDAQAAAVVRPFIAYPDLFDRDWAFGAVLAERLQANKITLAEANQQLTQHHSEITTEEQRRDLGRRSVAAQEDANRPVMCHRIGANTFCN